MTTSISPLVKPRGNQFSSKHLRLLSFVLGLAQLFELRTENWTNRCTRVSLLHECGHSGLKYAWWHAPASRYIVAYVDPLFRIYLGCNLGCNYKAVSIRAVPGLTLVWQARWLCACAVDIMLKEDSFSK